MTPEVKNICDKIETLMTCYHDNNHDLLYEKTLSELSLLNFSGIFIKTTELPLYRVRLNDKDNKPFVKSSDLNYAPAKFVCNYGRVNKPGQSMFYCSESETISTLELLHDYLLKNDIGHVRYATRSKWIIKKELYLLVMAIAPSNREFVNGYKIREKCYKFIESEPLTVQNNYFNLYSLTEHFFLMNAKNDYSVYVVCSAIANYFTLQFPEIDGLIFPTVQGNTGYNFVFRPHIVDNKMILPESKVSIEKWTVANKNQSNVDLNPKNGYIKDDDIIWDN